MCTGLSSPSLNKGDAPENISPVHIINGKNVKVSGTMLNNIGSIKNALM